MNYNELLQLYFDRSNALQNFWNIYVLAVGGILAFSSLRKQPAAVTTLLVCILFALFAYENLGAMKDCTAQRFAMLEVNQTLRRQWRGKDRPHGCARAARADFDPLDLAGCKGHSPDE